MRFRNRTVWICGVVSLLSVAQTLWTLLVYLAPPSPSRVPYERFTSELAAGRVSRISIDGTP